MAKSEESDWYHSVLSGAMKFIEIEEKDQSTEDPHALINAQDQDSLSIWEWEADEGKALFSKYVLFGYGKFGNRKPLARGIVGALTQSFFNLNVHSYPATQFIENFSVPSPIAEEDLDEKIATQLSAVIDESLLEFQEQRKNFKAKNQTMRNEFQQKLLQLSSGC